MNAPAWVVNEAWPHGPLGRIEGMSGRLIEVVGVFLRLGLTSFGGPVAHLGFFRETFVRERGWLDERSYAELVALCQFLPGPTSSQVGFALGLHRGGVLAGFCGALAFMLPAAVIMIGFGLGVAATDIADWDVLFQGLKAAAAAVVAWALWGMARSLCPDLRTGAIAVMGFLVVVVVAGFGGQLGAILLGAVVGGLLLSGRHGETSATTLRVPLGRRGALVAFGLFVLFLGGLPVLALVSGTTGGSVLDALYRSGALVFGGGHVVLPLLQTAVVEPGLIDADRFLAGYGVAQAMPGPLFTFGGYIGAVTGGLGLAVAATLTIFLPGFLLVMALLPLWQQVRDDPRLRRPLAGVNAAVVGILAAALWDPVLVHGVTSASDGMIALTALLLLASGRFPVWLIVAGCGLAAVLVAAMAH